MSVLPAPTSRRTDQTTVQATSVRVMSKSKLLTKAATLGVVVVVGLLVVQPCECVILHVTTGVVAAGAVSSMDACRASPLAPAGPSMTPYGVAVVCAYTLMLPAAMPPMALAIGVGPQ